MYAEDTVIISFAVNKPF